MSIRLVENKMTEINDEVRASLSEAGIGKAYHDRTIASVPAYGDGLKRILTMHGAEIRQRAFNAVWHGVGLTEAITLLCRGVHINGVGCMLQPLVRMRRIIIRPDFREAVDDADLLVIFNAQDTNRGNPLHDSVMSDLEDVLRKRLDNNKMTWLQFAVPEDVVVRDMPTCYWSDEFLDLVDEYFKRIIPSSIMTEGVPR